MASAMHPAPHFVSASPEVADPHRSRPHRSRKASFQAVFTGRRAGRAAAVLAATALVAGTALPSASAAPRLTLAEAQRQVHDLDIRASVATEAYDAGRLALADARRKAAGAQAAARQQSATLQVAEKAMGAFAAAAYRSGGTEGLVSLVTTADPQVFLDQASSLDQISRSRAARLLALKTARKRLTALTDAAAEQVAQASTLEHQLSADRATIDGLLAQQNAILNQLQAADRARIAADNVAAADRASRARVSAVTFAAAVPRYNGPGSGRAEAALQEAYRQLGKPYYYGAAGPDSYDCSGLTMWAFAHAGISLPHSAAAQYDYGTHVSPSDLRPGDLVFFDEGGFIGHVGIYVGNGNMIDAPHSGSYVGVRPLYSGLIGGTRL